MIGSFIIVDDHPLYRKGICALVEQEFGLRCAGEASSLEEARILLQDPRISLAIVDISLREENGLVLVKECRNLAPLTRILVVSMHDEIVYGERAIRSGAHGYVMKHQSSEILLSAIGQVLKGQMGISDELKDRLAERFAFGPTDGVSQLSNRENEVLRYIGRGYGLQEIADLLQISVKTVYTHQDRLKAKLGIESAGELRRFAVQWVKEHHP